MLVTTLNQRIIKGPVDVITCKALYTLNEDWLLWQVTEFSTVVCFFIICPTNMTNKLGMHVIMQALCTLHSKSVSLARKALFCNLIKFAYIYLV